MVTTGKACDHYRLYRGDVDLLAELGHQAYRMLIEWIRIELVEGQWDVTAVNHYVDLLDRLNQRGTQAFVTLHHFIQSQWFEQCGGFRERENLRFVERYLEYLLPKISEYVSGWNVKMNSIYGGSMNSFREGYLRRQRSGNTSSIC